MNNRLGGNLALIFWLAVIVIVSLSCSILSGGDPTPTTAPSPDASLVVEAESTIEGNGAGNPTVDPQTPAPSPTPFMPYFESADCAFVVPAEAEVDCGFVVVTEDRDGDLADTIRLAVAVYQSTAEGASDVPTFFLQGGPGATSVDWSARWFNNFISPLLAQGDVIFMDHRGTGFSEPNLNCPEIEATYLQDLQEEWDQETRTEKYGVAFLACKGRLVLSGANIKAYTTRDAAADVRDVAAVLGYIQLNLYGVSYGSRLGQAVMRDYPELVRSAVLDSVVPLEANMYNDATERANFALETLFAGCTADTACDAAYPNLESKFYETLSLFDEEPIEIEVNNPQGGEPLTLSVGDSSLLNSMMWALHTPSYVSQTPRIIDDVYRGDYEVLSLIKDLPFAGLANTNIGLRLSVECHDQIFPTTIEELEADINRYPALVDYGYSYIFGSIDLLFTVCNMWGAAPYDPADKEPLHSNIPTLILAGQYDPTTPAYYGRQLAGNLSNSYFIELPGHGHAPSVGQIGNCGLTVALIFLADPTARPDHACIEEQKELTFFVPFDGLDAMVLEPFTSLEHNLTGLVPAGWKFIGDGGYNRNDYLGDPTQIVFQASMVSAVEWVDFLEEYYQKVGLDSTPESAGTYEINGRRWKLYTAGHANNVIDIALLEFPDGWTWLIMMTTDPAERDAFYEQLFLPSMETLGWLGI